MVEVHLRNKSITHTVSTEPASVSDPIVDVHGYVHTGCGITASGDIYCWGRGDNYQRGDGITTQRVFYGVQALGHRTAHSPCRVATSGVARSRPHQRSSVGGMGLTGTSSPPRRTLSRRPPWTWTCTRGRRPRWLAGPVGHGRRQRWAPR